MSFLSAMANKYGTQVAASVPATKEKPWRVTVDNVFIQPTKTHDTKGKGREAVKTLRSADTWKYTYVYVGILDEHGDSITGFSMDTNDLCKAIDSKVIGESVMKAFTAYCEKYIAEGRTVMIDKQI